jgi:hypothetical protein
MAKATPEQRFWKKVNKTDTCWLWTGSLVNGFGQFKSERYGLAVQFCWELHYGPIPPKTRIKQTCGNRACVNPAHLTAGGAGRFWMKVDKNGPICPHLDSRCWLWTGAAKSTNGETTYGTFWDGEKVVPAHRYAYELHTGQMVPELDHRCRIRLCVNPEHLRPVTRKQNMENRGGAQANSRSGVLGVYPKRDKWLVQVRHNGQTYRGGSFKYLADAKKAVVELRNRLYTHNDTDRASR